MSAAARRWWRCSPCSTRSKPAAQAALMAPTEILARQHFATISTRSAKAVGVEIALLTGREKGPRARRTCWRGSTRARSESCRHPCAVPGRCRRSRIWRLAVIDEQHRFGVEQRIALSGKGPRRRYLGDDRDADPAHLGADRLWRSRCLAPRREAGGAAAGRHPHRAGRALRRGDRRRRARARRGATRSTGSAR